MIIVYVVAIITIIWGMIAAAVTAVFYFPKSIHLYAAIGICLLPTLFASLILLWSIRRRDEKYRRVIIYKIIATLIVIISISAYYEPSLVHNYIDTKKHASQSITASECRGILLTLSMYALDNNGVLPDTIPDSDPLIAKAKSHFTYQRPTPTSAPGIIAPRILLISKPGLLEDGARIVGLENGDVVLETKDAKREILISDSHSGRWKVDGR